MSSPAEFQKLGSFAAATISEATDGVGTLSSAIRSIGPGMRVVGRAFTVKLFPGDNLAVVHANALAKPGDVLVIDAGRTDPNMVVWGSSSTLAAKLRGIAGVVTNGAIRDLDQMLEIGLPIFAAGVSLRVNAKNHPGWLNVPISVGDVVVAPGDLVVGDSDGVIVVQQDRISDVLAKTVLQQKKEDERDRRIRSGQSIQDAMNIPGRG